uniref:Uncharacterized protein n=1 Tax=Lutzomyia longipalpis TaxID=7200 RepID=A0A1B0GIV9_LUTLO
MGEVLFFTLNDADHDVSPLSDEAVHVYRPESDSCSGRTSLINKFPPSTIRIRNDGKLWLVCPVSKSKFIPSFFHISVGSGFPFGGPHSNRAVSPAATRSYDEVSPTTSLYRVSDKSNFYLKPFYRGLRSAFGFAIECDRLPFGYKNIRWMFSDSRLHTVKDDLCRYDSVAKGIRKVHSLKLQKKIRTTIVVTYNSCDVYQHISAKETNSAVCDKQLNDN